MRYIVEMYYKLNFFTDWEKAGKGQGLVEYAMILFMVAIVVMVMLIILGPQVGSMFSAVTKGMS